MWILTGILLGSIITSTHDTQEQCEGRKAMLNQVKEVRLLECRSAILGLTSIGSGSMLVSPGTSISPTWRAN